MSPFCAGISVLVFSGVDDIVCNWMGSQLWLNGLVWGGTASWAAAPKATPWAGGTFQHAGLLTFAKVANAGHMSPMDQPTLMLQLLKQWGASGVPTATKQPKASRA